ncbi:MAG: glycosyltransferase family 39 protein, partial [Solirubrobacteraceae bacterium]
MATVSESAETRPHAPAAISTDRTVWAAVALTVLAAGLRLPGLGAQSYWFDESVTVWLTHFSLPGMLAVIPANESTPPLYYVLAWLWSHLWGTGEAGLRSLSALAGVATVPVAYATARRLWSGRAALIAAALTACNPLLIWYSQEARAYSLVVLLTAGCLLAGAHLRDRVDRGWAATWVACAGLALATHYFALLVVVPQWLWLAIRYRRDRRMRIALELVVAVALLLAPLAAAQLVGQQGAHSWMRSVSLAHRIADVPRTFALGPAAPAARWLRVAIAVATGIAGWLAWTRTSRRERAGIGLMLGLAAAATVIVALLIAAGYDELDYRNMLVVWLPCALALAGGLGARRAGRVGVTAALVICAVGVGTAVAVWAD